MKKNINFSAEEFVGKLNDEIAKQNLENLGAVVDNAGSIVISNAETEDECIINSNSSDDIEAFLKFVIENGLVINDKNIENFAEMTNFGLLDDAKNKAISIGGKLENIAANFKSKNEKLDKGKALDILINGITFQVGECDRLKETTKEVMLDFKKFAGASALKRFFFGDRINLKGLYKQYNSIEKYINTLIDKIGKDKCLKIYQENKELINKYSANTDDIKAIFKDSTEETSSADINKQIEELKTEAKNIIKKGGGDISKLNDEAKSKIKEIKVQLKDLEEKSKNTSDRENIDKSNNFSEYNFGEINSDDLAKRAIGQILVMHKVQIKKICAKLDLTKKCLGKSSKYADLLDKLKANWQKISGKIDKYLNTLDLENISKIIKKYEDEAEKELGDYLKSLQSEIDSETENNTNNKTETADNSKSDDESGFNKLSKALESKNISDETKGYLNNGKVKTQLKDIIKNKPERLSEALTKLKVAENVAEEVAKYVTDNDSSDKKEDESSPLDNFSEVISKVFSEKVTNFDAHKVKDSEFGIVYEDKFGSLWSDDPDTNSNADILWESADGKEEPTTEDKTDEDENENTDSESAGDELGEGSEEEGEGGDELDLDSDSDTDDESGDDELDLDSDTSEDELFSESNDELDLDSEDNDDELDLDSDDELDLDSEDNELDLDTDDNEDENNTEEKEKTSEGENLSKALDVIQSMYQVLAEKIK